MSAGGRSPRKPRPRLVPTPAAQTLGEKPGWAVPSSVFQLNPPDDHHAETSTWCSQLVSPTLGTGQPLSFAPLPNHLWGQSPGWQTRQWCVRW